MKQTSFLWKNRHGVYFFRVRVPKQFIEHFGGAEIKRSLKTDSYRLAVKLARAYRVELDREMEKLEKGTYGAFSVTLKVKTPITLPNGEKKPVESRMERNLASPDELPQLREHFFKQHEREVERQEKQARDQALFDVQLAAIKASTLPSSATQPLPRPDTSPPYSEVVKFYLAEGDATGRWKSKSKDFVENALDMFKEFVGDPPIKSIDKKIAREFKAQYLKTPSNRKSKPEYRDKTITDLLSIDIPKDDLVDIATVANNIGHIGTFFKWAENNDYVDSNPIEGLRPKVKKKASKQRDAFDKADLIKLFESQEYTNGFNWGDKTLSWRYWIPIVALYTGMRLEEICRLRTESIAERDGIKVIDVKPYEDWETKTEAGSRIVPIHPKLEALGFLTFVKQQTKSNEQRIFFELIKREDGYGTTVSRWFANYKKKCGISGEKKVFHSFRHTLSNELKQLRIPLEVTQAILGHESSSMSYGRYGKDYRPDVMFEAIKQIDFELQHPPFKFK